MATKNMFGALALLIAGGSAASADCGAAREVFSAMDGPMEIRAYKGPDVVTSGPYLFEGRIGGKLVWRVAAEYACSNGIPACLI